MSRKRCNRKPVRALPPRCFRPKLDAGQRRDLDLAHLVNLDAIAAGDADEGILWHIAGAVLTWTRVAELLGQGVEEMLQQMDLVSRVIARYGVTGVIGFEANDYDAARTGIAVMESLADLVDQPTAIAAAEWSERQVEGMRRACARREASTAVLQGVPA